MKTITESMNNSLNDANVASIKTKLLKLKYPIRVITPSHTKNKTDRDVKTYDMLITFLRKFSESDLYFIKLIDANRSEVKLIDLVNMSHELVDMVKSLK